MNLADVTCILSAYLAPTGGIESALAGHRVTLEFDRNAGAIARECWL